MSSITPIKQGAGVKPACPRCGHNEHVRRMWVGREKMWYCDEHFLVTSTEKKDATLWQRFRGKMPAPDTMKYSDVFPNREARRRQRGGRS